MRQVPHPLIVGDGKMATHMVHYLSLLGINFSQWSRKNHSASSLDALFNQSHLTLLLISDANLEHFLNSNSFLTSKPVVHFSGALSIEAMMGAHPLMTFSNHLYDLEFYKKITFILEKSNSRLNNPLDFLPNNFFEIPAESKTYYHMLCALSGNFTCILWQKFFNELEATCQLPKAVGELYLKQITQNIIENPNTALTGPLIRNDKITLNKHLDALETDEFKNIYQAFIELFEQRRNSIHEHS